MYLSPIIFVISLLLMLVITGFGDSCMAMADRILLIWIHDIYNRSGDLRTFDWLPILHFLGYFPFLTAFCGVNVRFFSGAFFGVNYPNNMMICNTITRLSLKIGLTNYVTWESSQSYKLIWNVGIVQITKIVA